jgi:hypothetical protein
MEEHMNSQRNASTPPGQHNNPHMQQMNAGHHNLLHPPFPDMSPYVGQMGPGGGNMNMAPDMMSVILDAILLRAFKSVVLSRASQKCLIQAIVCHICHLI